ncbi:MAG: phosphonate C-P lyase system protein PhnL [Deltaproteobacteria bacterium]|jgi:alpha-D-ribose 1-methylphosphonate 5-triphosphate synthase subunit PhnL|nr:phosphonate C-P lyase system protein PhnL [Deltaproteobacteria bacterium]
MEANTENTAIAFKDICKTFTLHNLKAQIKALSGESYTLSFGQCLAINGPSGIGKSTLLRCLYGNYLVSSGEIKINHRGKMVDLVRASQREILEIRTHTISYVSQFLRVIPRVSALDIVAAPIIEKGLDKETALERAREYLLKLNIQERLHKLPPMTFSGGERQRVNIARGLARLSPILLLDEPCASLDFPNRQVAMELFLNAKAQGVAIVGIFHDAEARESVADVTCNLQAPKA